MLKLSVGQRATVRQTLTTMEADTGMLFVWLESLRVHVGGEYLAAVQGKLAEAVEAMRQLKVLVRERSGGGDAHLRVMIKKACAD